MSIARAVRSGFLPRRDYAEIYLPLERLPKIVSGVKQLLLIVLTTTDWKGVKRQTA